MRGLECQLVNSRQSAFHETTMSLANDTDYKFEGWIGPSVDAVQGHMQFQSFEAKAWDEDEVDVRIQYCGICGSDVPALGGEWGPVRRSLAGMKSLGKSSGRGARWRMG
jgi:hypothetical protein